MSSVVINDSTKTHANANRIKLGNSELSKRQDDRRRTLINVKSAKRNNGKLGVVNANNENVRYEETSTPNIDGNETNTPNIDERETNTSNVHANETSDSNVGNENVHTKETSTPSISVSSVGDKNATSSKSASSKADESESNTSNTNAQDSASSNTNADNERSSNMVSVTNNSSNTFNYYMTVHNNYFKKIHDKMQLQAVLLLMNMLRCYISFRTELCYNMPSINQACEITIPIDVLSNNDMKQTPEELVSAKIQVLKNYLEKEIDYESFLDNHKSSLSYVLNYKFDFKHMLFITNNLNSDVIQVSLKTPTIIKTVFKTTTIKTSVGDDEVMEVINPYIHKAMIMFDYSVPYSEMGFTYNILHLFEHILCSPWTNMHSETNKLCSMNGVTYGTGNCFVYAILKDKSNFDNYLKNEISFIYKCRNREYWDSDEMKEVIEKETQRTISETKRQPGLTSFARSPGCAFNFGYDKGVFHYWSSKPFNCFIIHPWTDYSLDVDCFKDLISSNTLTKVERPKIPTFKYYPYSNFAFSSVLGATYSKKMEPKEIANILKAYFFKNKIYDGRFGYDVCIREISNRTSTFCESKIMIFPLAVLLTTYRKFWSKAEYEQIVTSILTFCSNYDVLFEEHGDIDVQDGMDRNVDFEYIFYFDRL